MPEAIWLFVLLGLAAAVTTMAMLVLWTQLRQAHRELDQQERILQQALEEKARAEEQAKRTALLEQQIAELQESKTRLLVELAELRRAESLSKEKLEWLDQAQSALRDTFKALATDAMRGSAGDFLKLAQAQVEQLLARARGDWTAHKEEIHRLLEPISFALKTLSEHVRELEQKREGAYQGLQEQLRQLAQAHYQLQTTTVTLSQALRSHAVRGRWGEYQLRRVVEMAGMIAHVDFAEQVATDTGQRVDMVIHMPNQGLLPVDAKAPMDAYLDALSASDEQTRDEKLKEHAKAMRDRVRELGQRRYSEQFAQTPELVVMFVPIEACLSAAFERDPSLLEFAFEHGVLIATPVTLLALLKAVAHGWQQRQISENTLRVAELGRDLYRSFLEFAENLSKLSRRLDDSVKTYNQAVATFKGKLIPISSNLSAVCSMAEQPKLPPPVRSQVQEISVTDRSE
ncbi:MAG: DNA recombination protein RmuC [Anaerolineae bacterium]|nr:DNA recombination protein RmuC [Anaerolineae bacterium]